MTFLKLKREKFKGKFYLTLRDDKNRVIDRKLWSKKFQKKDAVKQIKKTNSLNDTLEVVPLSKVVEFTDYSSKPQRGRGMYQYIVEMTINGTPIQARSQNHANGFPVDKARQEAFTNLFERVSEHMGGEYEEDEGRRFVNSLDKPPKVREGIVRYEAK